MMIVYNDRTPKELVNITKKVNPIKKVDSDRSFLDDTNTHEYLTEETDEEILTYDNKGKLVHIRKLNK